MLVAKVLFFPAKRWMSDVDYMFFRNSMPNIDKLKIKLGKTTDDSSDYGAYCCQCSWTDVKVHLILKIISNGKFNESKLSTIIYCNIWP